jgi:hypothetical protein
MMRLLAAPAPQHCFKAPFPINSSYFLKYLHVVHKGGARAGARSVVWLRLQQNDAPLVAILTDPDNPFHQHVKIA